MKVYYIPNGVKNLQALFPALDFNTMQQYYIEVQSTGGQVIATGTINELDGYCCSDKVRIRFINYLGAVDGINFRVVTDEHSAAGDTWQRATPYPLVKTAHAIGRTNVRANNSLTLSCIDYREDDLKWVNELVDSPLAWIEWTGTQGQPDAYIPIIVLDGKILNRKTDDRFEYDVIINITYSNEKFIIRN